VAAKGPAHRLTRTALTGTNRSQAGAIDHRPLCPARTLAFAAPFDHQAQIICGGLTSEQERQPAVLARGDLVAGTGSEKAGEFEHG